MTVTNDQMTHPLDQPMTVTNDQMTHPSDQPTWSLGPSWSLVEDAFISVLALVSFIADNVFDNKLLAKWTRVGGRQTFI